MDHEKQPTSYPALADEVPAGRMIWISVPEIAAATRDRALAEREELVRLRELALDARREADDARAEREHLLGQLREANEKLVTAIVEAQQRADEANAARIVGSQLLWTLPSQNHSPRFLPSHDP